MTKTVTIYVREETMSIVSFVASIVLGTGFMMPTRVFAQAFAQGATTTPTVYLSQVPYTGLDLGPVGTTLYWLALFGWSLALAYLIVFGAMPFVRLVRSFGERVSAVLNAPKLAPVMAHVEPTGAKTAVHAPTTNGARHEAPRGYSAYDGFKSFARDGALSIDDIVKGLSQEHPQPATVKDKAGSAAHAEPIHEKEESIRAESKVAHEAAHSFASALLGGDRAAVFASLREHAREAGTPMALIASAAFLLDDVYRARIDGSHCDAVMERLAARLDTPILEKLIGALATAIDSSYTDSITGAKLALTRALAVLGA